MNGPHCQKELPVDNPAEYCPFGVRDLPSETATSSPEALFKPKQVSWLKVFTLWFAPAIGCFFATVMNLEVLAVLFTVFGSIISGLICTRMILAAVGLAGFKYVIAQVGLALFLWGFCFSLGFLGGTGPDSLSSIHALASFQLKGQSPNSPRCATTLR